MEITLNVNIPSLDRFCDLLVKELSKEGKTFTGPTTPAAPAGKADDSDIPAHIARAAAEAAAAETKPAGKGRRSTKEAPAAATPAAAPAAAAGEAAATTLTRDVVKAKLTDYSADKRYGMEGVMKKLGEYGVQRISDLPEAKFQAFYDDLSNALAAPAKGPLD